MRGRKAICVLLLVSVFCVSGVLTTAATDGLMDEQWVTKSDSVLGSCMGEFLEDRLCFTKGNWLNH